jgi:7-carboxy-7-deazaguanine synthase
MEEVKKSSSNSSLFVSEIFSSIQGEGVNLGEPAIFLRLAFCNLHCWFCDTKYTWLYSVHMQNLVVERMKELGVESWPQDLKVYSQKEEAKPVSILDAAAQILQHDAARLVITGGEPLLQQDGLTLLLEELRRKSEFVVEIETNGTIRPKNRIIPLVHQWNVSPKLASAGNSPSASEKPECIEAFKKLNSYFKFVIQDEEDLKESESLIRRYGLPMERIFLMPEGTDPLTLKKREEFLLRYCEERGYKASTRLHILLYGNARGR